MSKEILSPIFLFVFAVALLAILAWFVVKIRSWLREDADPDESFHELLTQYREMHRQGELSDEEFRLIKSRFIAQLGSGLQCDVRRPAKPAQDATAPERIPDIEASGT